MRQSDESSRAEKLRDERLPPPSIEGWLDERDVMSSTVVLGGAVGFLIGVLAWGALFLALISGVQNVFDDLSPGSGTALETGNGVDVIPVDCSGLVEREARSVEDGLDSLTGCPTPTSEVAEPALTATPAAATIPATDTNRFNCADIRGTNYLSQEERDWFLANCLTPSP